MMVKSRIMNYVPILLIGLLTVGCKLGESYTQPELDDRSDFYGVTRSVTEGTNLSETHWKTFFKDSLLISLIDTALQNNVDMQIADAYLAIATSNLNQAKANFYPSLGFYPFRYRRDFFSENYNNYGSNRARRIYGGPGPPPPQIPESFYTERIEYESSLVMNWELDIWKKLSSQKKARQLAYMRSVEFKKAVQTELISTIASTYFVLGLLKSQIAVYKGNLELSTNTLRIVKLQFDAGEVTSLAVKQTLSQKLRAQTLIPQLERAYVKQENELNRLIGRGSQAIEMKHLEEPVIDDNYVLGLPLDLLGNRPDVFSAELQLQESYQRVGVANAMRYPAVNIGASLGLNSFQLENLLNPAGSGFLLLNGAIFQPIFQNRRLKTNYEIALQQKKIAELNFKNQFQVAVNEVSNAVVAIEKLKEEYLIAQERVAAARNAVDDASFLFRSGLADYLEVITAQSEALDSELNLENVKMQLFSADVELYRSLGGGWR